METLRQLVAHPKVDIALLLQFSTAFNIHKNDVLTLYSEALLMSLEAVVDSRGDIVVYNFEEVTAKVDKCLEMVEDHALPYEHLTKLFSAVSPYNYAVLEFILKKLYQTQVYREERPPLLTKADKVLGFLLQYKRVSEPGAETEVDTWIKERGCPLPGLAKRRLPLYSLVTLPPKDKYKWLEKEFTLDTFKPWMTVAKVLGLIGDNICYYAVKNTVTEMMETNARDGLAGEQGDTEWVFSHVNKNILENIQECIRCMRDSEKATAASNWVVNRLPRGKDKVLASVGAETIVQAWHHQLGAGAGAGDSVRAGLDISRRKRRQLETEEALHRHGLAARHYTDLVHTDKPLELLLRLYEDPSIEARTEAAAGSFPDINTAAATIAAVHEINLVSVKHELLDKLLPVSAVAGGGGGHDDTMADFTLNLHTLGKQEEAGRDVDEVNLVRCVYLLQGCRGQEEAGLQYLLKFGFSTDPGVSTQHKLRALKCLFSVCSEARLQQLTGRPAADIRQYLRSLVYLSRLEALHLPFTLQSLEAASSKPEPLVEAVWRVAKGTREGVLVVRDLCSEYGLWSPAQWAALLDRMTQLGLVPELTSTLLSLNSQPQLWNSPQFLRAWNTVLQVLYYTVLYCNVLCTVLYCASGALPHRGAARHPGPGRRVRQSFQADQLLSHRHGPRLENFGYEWEL